MTKRQELIQNVQVALYDYNRRGKSRDFRNLVEAFLSLMTWAS